jgi:hypothetical protein
MNRKLLVCELASFFLILLFTYTAVSKLTEPGMLRYMISQIGLPGRVSYFLSYFIPLTELVIAFLLIVPPTRKHGFFSAFLILLVFSIYVGGMLVFAPVLPCSCGGVISLMGWESHLVFNLSCTALAYWCWRKQPAQGTLHRVLLFLRSNSLFE